MKNYNEMTGAELKAIAREHKMPGAWKATKAQMIEFLSNLDAEETKIPGEDYEATVIDGTLVAVSKTEDITESSQNDAEPIETESHETNQEAQENATESNVDDSEHAEEKPAPKRGALLAFNGKEQNICAWAKELGISANTLYGRIYKMGWTIERAFTTPARSK